MKWVTIKIDLQQIYLERRLQGIVINPLPTFDPKLWNGSKPATARKRYKVNGLAAWLSSPW